MNEPLTDLKTGDPVFYGTRFPDDVTLTRLAGRSQSYLYMELKVRGRSGKPITLTVPRDATEHHLILATPERLAEYEAFRYRRAEQALDNLGKAMSGLVGAEVRFRDVHRAAVEVKEAIEA